MKATNPVKWDLLDKTGITLVEHIVEDKDQGPKKEWGPFGWYRHPLSSDITKADYGKTVYLLLTIPV